MLRKLSVTYDGHSISLENVTTLVLLGDNGVGKTAFLERIALTNEENIGTILNVKGSVNYENFSVNIDDEEVKCECVKAERTYETLDNISRWIPFESRCHFCEGSSR